MNNDQSQDLPENEAELLLPFHVNGTLDDADRLKVETWLERKPERRAHLARVEEELALVRADAETRGVPPRHVLDSLMAKTGETAGAASPGGFVERIWAMLSPRYALAGALALLAIAVFEAGYIYSTHPVAQAGFQTATAESAAFAGPSALVLFSPESAWGSVAAYLSELGLTIIDGPKPGGFFVVGAPDSDAGRAALAELAGNDGFTSFFQLRK